MPSPTPDEHYEIDNPEVKATLRSIATKIGAVTPEGWGFVLFLFEFGTPDNPGSNFYIANAEREDIITMLEEWIAKQRGEAA